MKNRNLNHADDWATPPNFYQKLDKEFSFDFDPCPLNPVFDGLSVEWQSSNFINPPYSRLLKEMFIKKAIEESKKNKMCVCLLPVSTSTAVFHDYVQPNAKEIRFIKGRIPFIGVNTKGEYVNWHLWDTPAPPNCIQVKNSGMHDSMIVVFGK